MTTEENIISLSDCEKKIDENYFKGQKEGTTTYFENSVDTCWKWRTGEFNLWTGYMAEGKSELLKQLCIVKALKEGKKFAFFSPENMPEDEFYLELMYPLYGKNPYRHSKYFNYSDADFKMAKDFLKDHFYIVHPKSRKIREIHEGFRYLKEYHNIYGCILDPFLKINHESETNATYISNFMAACCDFSKEIDISYSLVAHQLTPTVDDKTQNYTKPDPYRIKGGGNFADGADNILLVWRPRKRTDKLDPSVHFESAKIKRHELVSQPNDVELQFDYKTKWYKYGGKNPIDDHWNNTSDLFNKKVRKKLPSDLIDDFNKEAPF